MSESLTGVLKFSITSDEPRKMTMFFTQGMFSGLCVPVVVDVWISTYAVLEADVQVIPETAMQYHISHHPDPVFNLQGRSKETKKLKTKLPRQIPHSHLCSVLGRLLGNEQNKPVIAGIVQITAQTIEFTLESFVENLTWEAFNLCKKTDLV